MLFRSILDIITTELPDEQIITAIKNYSNAWAVAAILFSANKNFSRGRNIFPVELCQKYGLKAEDYGSKEFISTSKNIVKELVETALAMNNNNKIIKIENPLKAKLKPLLTYKKLANYRLQQISMNGYDIFTKNYNPYISFITLIKIFF